MISLGYPFRINVSILQAPRGQNMIAEIISIGDELTSGQRLDTNSQWISQQLGNLGIQVVYHTTVADLVDANIAVFGNAMNRANIVVTTGGLGPTADDLTRQSLAETLGVGLYRDLESLDHIRSLFSRRNRDMPTQNEVQADFPEGSVPLLNANGSAPGILFEQKKGKRNMLLMAFPGVPAELREMFTRHAIPRLEAFQGARKHFLVHKPIRCFGIGESDLESRLPELFKRGRDPQVGITASAATITLRITAEGATEEQCQQKIESTESIIRDVLGDLVFGAHEQELQHVLFETLRSASQTLALAEVGTGGYLSHLFSEIDPEGSVFVGSSIARTNDRVHKILETDCKPSETATHLAEKTRNFYASDYSIAIDAFPDNDADLLQIAVATPSETVAAQKPFAGHPSIHLPRAAKQAMNELRRWLLRNEPGKPVAG